jgi:esterase/lipase superfamily enzyme
MRRFLLILLALIVVAGGVTVAISFHHPPMRLMPPPAVFLDDRAGVVMEGATDPEMKLFYATNREARGTPENRDYARVPGAPLHAGELTIRIGDDATTLDRIFEWSTRAGDDPRPYLHLQSVTEQATIAPDAPLSAEAEAWFAALDAAIAASTDKDVIIYVHGANTTLERAAGQAAQLQHFTGRDAVVLLFAWPTAENFLLYTRDMRTAAASAPQFARLVELLGEHTSAKKIDVFTYSAGGTVGSDGLAIVGRDAASSGTDPRIGEVYHAAPDADFRTFVDDMKDYAGRAARTTVAANMNDSALRLSALVNRGSRAGRPDMEELSPEATEFLLRATDEYGLELLRVRPENMYGLSNFSHTFWYDDPWVSSDVLFTLLYHLTPDERGLEEGESAIGSHYWTFTPDYPARLSSIIDHLRQSGEIAPGDPLMPDEPAPVAAEPVP